MANPDIRDFIIIQEDNGVERQFAVEALFDLEEVSYALLAADEDILLMRIEEEDDEQYLVGLDNPEEAENILHAYQVAVERSPAE